MAAETADEQGEAVVGGRLASGDPQLRTGHRVAYGHHRCPRVSSEQAVTRMAQTHLHQRHGLGVYGAHEGWAVDAFVGRNWLVKMALVPRSATLGRFR